MSTLQAGISFNDVLSQPAYQALAAPQQAEVADAYFQKNVASQPNYQGLDANRQNEVKNAFYQKYSISKIGDSGFGDKIATQSLSDLVAQNQHQQAQNTNFFGDMYNHAVNAATGYQQDDLLRNSGQGVGSFLGDALGGLVPIGAGTLLGAGAGSVVPVLGTATGGVAGGIAGAGGAGIAQDLQAQRLEGAQNPNWGRAATTGLIQGGLQAIPVVGQGGGFLGRVIKNAAVQGAGGGLGSVVQQGAEQQTFTPKLDWGRVQRDTALALSGGAVGAGFSGRGKPQSKYSAKNYKPSVTPPTEKMQSFLRAQNANERVAAAENTAIGHQLTNIGNTAKLTPEGTLQAKIQKYNNIYEKLVQSANDPQYSPQQRATFSRNAEKVKRAAEPLMQKQQSSKAQNQTSKQQAAEAIREKRRADFLNDKKQLLDYKTDKTIQIDNSKTKNKLTVQEQGYRNKQALQVQKPVNPNKTIKAGVSKAEQFRQTKSALQKAFTTDEHMATEVLESAGYRVVKDPSASYPDAKRVKIGSKWVKFKGGTSFNGFLQQNPKLANLIANKLNREGVSERFLKQYGQFDENSSTKEYNQREQSETAAFGEAEQLLEQVKSSKTIDELEAHVEVLESGRYQLMPDEFWQNVSQHYLASIERLTDGKVSATDNRVPTASANVAAPKTKTQGSAGRETVYPAKRANKDIKPIAKEAKLPGLDDVAEHPEVKRRPELIEKLNQSYLNNEYMKPKYEAEIHGTELDKLPTEGVVALGIKQNKDSSVSVSVVDGEGQVRTYKLFDGKDGSVLNDVKLTGKKSPFKAVRDMGDLTRSGEGRHRVIDTRNGQVVEIFKPGETAKSSEIRNAREKIINVADRLKAGEQVSTREIVDAAKKVDMATFKQELEGLTQEQINALGKDLDC